MARPLRRFLAVLVAVLLAINAAGAAALQVPLGTCCGDAGPSSEAPQPQARACHDAAHSLACGHEGGASVPTADASGDSCAGGCAHCSAPAGVVPAVLPPATPAHAASPGAYERPTFVATAAGEVPAHRLERPPSAAPRC